MKKIFVFMLLIVAVLYPRDWHENYKGTYPHVWYFGTVETTHATFAAYDSACVKFDTLSGRWIVDIFDSSGVDVWRIYYNGKQRIYDGTDSIQIGAGFVILDSGGDEDLGLTIKNGAGSFTKLFPDSSNFQNSAMVITNEGRVGFGESNPDRAFVVNSGNADAGIKLESTDENCKLEMTDSDNQATLNSGGNGFKIYIGSDNDEFFLNAEGDLGLGTTDPDDKVTIYGSNPILTITDSDVNSNITPSAEQQDTSAIVLNSTDDPDLYFASSIGDSWNLGIEQGDTASFNNASFYRFDNYVLFDKWYCAKGGFQDSSVTIDLTQSTWAQVTNAYKTLWSCSHVDGFTFSNDTITGNFTGCVGGICTLTFSGTAQKEYQLRIYNVTQTRQEGFLQGVTGNGANNYVQVVVSCDIDLTSGDELVLQVQNISGNEDIILKHGQFALEYGRKDW